MRYSTTKSCERFYFEPYTSYWQSHIGLPSTPVYLTTVSISFYIYTSILYNVYLYLYRLCLYLYLYPLAEKPAKRINLPVACLDGASTVDSADAKPLQGFHQALHPDNAFCSCTRRKSISAVFFT